LAKEALKEEPSTEVVAQTDQTAMVTTDGEVLPFSDDMFAGSDMGYSEDSNDSLVPVLAILQDQSGEVKKKHEKYVEGTEAGQFVIRSLQMFFPPEKPILFQPCGFTHDWVEWTGEPGEGGAPVAQYPYEKKPLDVDEVVNKDGKKEWRMSESGNRLVETRHHFGNVVTNMQTGEVIPVVIAMSGTNHGVSRQWTALMKQFRAPNGQKAKSFMRVYELTTVFTAKGSQSWYKFKVKDAGWVANRNVMEAGFEFFKAIAAQEVKAGSDSEDLTQSSAADLADAPI
jgi:hypothetical protein